MAKIAVFCIIRVACKLMTAAPQFSWTLVGRVSVLAKESLIVVYTLSNGKHSERSQVDFKHFCF